MTTPLTGDRSFDNQVIRISDFTVTENVLQDYTFSNCKIIGPAVLAFGSDITMSHCVFESDVNSIFWEIDPTTRPMVFGAVGMVRCVFSRCTFEQIGFAGTRELREVFETELGQS